jgi:superfamily I DNA/RNA helicase
MRWRDDAPQGADITRERFIDFDSLCRGIVSNIADSGRSPGDWFVLSRTRAECAAIHNALLMARIPAVNKSGGLLFGAPHIRKVLAYARLACNFNNARDDKEILTEIANVASINFVAPMTRRSHKDNCTNEKPWVDCGCPTVIREGIDNSHVRYYGKESIEKAGNWQGILYQQHERNKGHFPSMASKGATDLVMFVTELEDFNNDARKCLEYIIENSVLPWIEHEEGITDQDASENGKQEDFQLLLEQTKPGQTVEQFLTDIDELGGRDKGNNDAESVIVGTVHWSKGAERPAVILNTTRMPITPPFIPKDKLPTSRANSVEEERCICYVGATRAKDQLCVMFSGEWLGKQLQYSFGQEM